MCDEKSENIVNECSPDPSPKYRNLRRARSKSQGNYDEKTDQWSPSFNADERGYVVVVEGKDDEPLVYETYLGRTSYEDAHQRMEELSQRPQVIRCAVAKLIYVSGHHGLVDNR